MPSVSIYLDDIFYTELVEYARKQGLPPSQYIVKVLKENMARIKREEKP